VRRRATVDNHASGRFVAPSLAATTAAMERAAIPNDTRIMLTNSSNPETYPIVGMTWLLVYRSYDDPAKGAAVVDFLRWALTNGQQTTWQLQYAPLSADVLGEASALVDQIHY
jgi:phosphate transport system substrate-binding protein